MRGEGSESGRTLDGTSGRGVKHMTRVARRAGSRKDRWGTDQGILRVKRCGNPKGLSYRSV